MRRRFLRNAGLSLAAGLAFPSLIPGRALGRGGAVPPSSRITLGVIGASQGMVNAERFLGFPDVQVTAVCDVDAVRLARAVRRINSHYGNEDVRPWGDFREMFARGGLDAVIIAPPDHWHGLMAIAAARAGLDVFGEKPVAHTLVEGRAVVNAIKHHGRVWQTGSWQRSERNFRQAAELVRNGRLGKISHVEIGTYGGLPPTRSVPADHARPPGTLDYDLWVGPAPWTDYDTRVTHNNWRYVLEYGGGKLMDWVGHHGDIAQWALGLDGSGPLKITATGAFGSTPPYDAAYKYNCTLTCASGTELRISSDFQPGAKFVGENGWIFASRGRGMGGTRYLDASSPDLLADGPGRHETHLYRSDDHWRNFIDCVKTRRETVAPVEAGHRSSSIGHLCHIAMQTGRTIHWDPAAENIQDDPGAASLLCPAFRAPWAL